ncbi:MAG: sulfite exporter TauE/SafE family protein, partial [Nitrospinota bacterium]
LEPGHGKTVVATYLISQQGRPWHALFLAIIVTISHTASVFLLALLIRLALIQNPELHLVHFLEVGAGIFISGLGVWLLFRALRGRHHAHSHGHPAKGGGGAEGAPSSIGIGTLLSLGVSSGAVPCPGALAVLAAALAAGKLGEGLSYVVVFSVGLAGALMTIGLLATLAAGWAKRHRDTAGHRLEFLPAVGACVIIGLGGLISLRALGLI